MPYADRRTRARGCYADDIHGRNVATRWNATLAARGDDWAGRRCDCRGAGAGPAPGSRSPRRSRRRHRYGCVMLRVAITRAQPEADRTAERVRARGAEAIVAPLL